MFENNSPILLAYLNTTVLVAEKLTTLAREPERVFLPLSTPGGTSLFSPSVVAVALAVVVLWWLVRRLSSHLSRRRRES